MTTLFFKIGITLLLFWLITFATLRFAQIKHEDKKNIINFLSVLSRIIGIIGIIIAVLMVVSFVWTASVFEIIMYGAILLIVGVMIFAIVMDIQ